MPSPCLARRLVRGAFTLCVLAIGLLDVSAAAVRIVDDPNGFNGYTWGTPRASYPSLQHVKDVGSAGSEEKLSVYENPGEVVTLNGVPLTRIQYRFLGDRLERIAFSYEGRENREKLLRWLEERYGKLMPAERKLVNQVEWLGDKTEVTLSYNLGRKDGALLFISRVLGERLYNSNLGGGGIP
jgi:hypothetical protein